MLTIYGRATSSNVQAVMWGVGEMGIAHRRLDVGGPFGGNDTPEFLAMNPMGRVPVIQDDQVTLFESQAILRYFAARHGARSLWPDDPVLRAPIDQWMEWSKTSVAPTFTYKVFWQLVRTAAAERDGALVAEGIAETDHHMTIAERCLAQHDWLAGGTMSLADISFGTTLFRYFTLSIDRPDLPRLEAYYRRLCDRPAYREHVMVSYESLRVPGA